MYRRTSADRVGEYRDERRIVEDYDYWIRLCLAVPARYTIKCCYYYRKHPDSLSTSIGWTWKDRNAKLQREHFGRTAKIAASLETQLCQSN